MAAQVQDGTPIFSAQQLLSEEGDEFVTLVCELSLSRVGRRPKTAGDLALLCLLLVQEVSYGA